MHLEESIKGEAAVIALKGELIDADDETVLQQKVASLTIDGMKKIIIDLGRVSRINSRGLSALIAAAKTVRERGGDIRFAQLDDHLKDIFVKTRLVKVFETYENVGRALASYGIR